MNLTAREVLCLFGGVELTVMLLSIGNLVIDNTSRSPGRAILGRSVFITFIGIAGLVGVLVTRNYV